MRPPISVVRETISLPAVDKVLTREDLASLANLTGMLSASWDSLASYLIGSHKVEEIKVDCRGLSADAMKKVWEVWVDTAEEDKRTLMYLMRAVTTIGAGAVADDIGKKCTPPYSGKIEKIVLRLPLLEPLKADNKVALYNIVLEKLGAKWDNLGIALGFQPSALETIEADHRGDNASAARKLLSQWVDKGGATMDKFLKASESIIGYRVIQEIRENYCQ